MASVVVEFRSRRPLSLPRANDPFVRCENSPTAVLVVEPALNYMDRLQRLARVDETAARRARDTLEN